MMNAIAVCWGVGVDSTAMLIEMARRGIRPDLITFADVGAEKPGTYDFLPVFTEWLVDHDFPRPLICTNDERMKPETKERYAFAVDEVLADLKITVTDEEHTRLCRIYGNMVANETLPSITFGGKSCSIRWKVEAQEFQ